MPPTVVSPVLCILEVFLCAYDPSKLLFEWQYSMLDQDLFPIYVSINSPAFHSPNTVSSLLLLLLYLVSYYMLTGEHTTVTTIMKLCSLFFLGLTIFSTHALACAEFGTSCTPGTNTRCECNGGHLVSLRLTLSFTEISALDII